MCAPKHFRHPVHSCQRFWNKQVGRHVSDSVGPSSIIKEGRYLCATLCAEGGLLTPHWVSVLSRLISVLIFIGAFERGERAERKCVCKPITFNMYCFPKESFVRACSACIASPLILYGLFSMKRTRFSATFDSNGRRTDLTPSPRFTAKGENQAGITGAPRCE